MWQASQGQKNKQRDVPLGRKIPCYNAAALGQAVVLPCVCRLSQLPGRAVSTAAAVRAALLPQQLLARCVCGGGGVQTITKKRPRDGGNKRSRPVCCNS